MTNRKETDVETDKKTLKNLGSFIFFDFLMVVHSKGITNHKKPIANSKTDVETEKKQCRNR